MTESQLNHTLDLPHNYSILINKLEQLALGLGNFSVDRKEYEIASVATSTTRERDHLIDSDTFGFGNPDPIASGRLPPPRVQNAHGITEAEEYSRVVSDIWIGVILTLLIVSVIFFICACFLYHKFQQWKNSYRTSPNTEQIEICRRCPPDYEGESLPSYTIVSGLPTYDDALEEFRKAGLVLTPSAPIIKVFDADSKETQSEQQQQQTDFRGSCDNISMTSTCTCGANNNNNIGNNTSTTNLSVPYNTSTAILNGSTTTLTPPVIELSPEHLAALSQKRLSLQIAFNNSIRRNSRPRIDLRNNLLRSRAACNNAGIPNNHPMDIFPSIHRSSSTNSLVLNERGLLDRRLQVHHLQHRGSLC